MIVFPRVLEIYGQCVVAEIYKRKLLNEYRLRGTEFFESESNVIIAIHQGILEIPRRNLCACSA